MHMRLRSTRVIAFVLTIIVSCEVFAGSETGLIVTSEGIRFANGRHQLVLAVWNCGGEAIDADIASLPWGENTLGMTIRRVGLMPTAELNQSYRVNDFPVKKITISSKGVVRGVVDLSEYFVSLERSAKSDDFIVFWTYNTGLLGESPARQVAGIELISHQSQSPSTLDKHKHSEICRR